MENKGLIFIPDISGFTRFVNSVEIEHSQHIIQELLEVLLDANEMDLEVSEIEGDAILFYKFGALPDLGLAYRQVEKMFLAFHKHLEFYERRRTCHCKACISAIRLTLKIITHYGEFREYRILNFRSLIGRDVILAHQLLKNDISHHEYWLITNSLSPGKPPRQFNERICWNQGTKKWNEGEIPFHFTQLSYLKE